MQKRMKTTGAETRERLFSYLQSRLVFFAVVGLLIFPFSLPTMIERLPKSGINGFVVNLMKSIRQQIMLLAVPPQVSQCTNLIVDCANFL